MNRSGIVVTNRLEFFRRAQENGTLAKRTPAIPRTHEQVFRAYRGFDGIQWPGLDHPGFAITKGVARFEDCKLVDAYVQELPRRDECEVIALTSSLSGWAISAEWRFAGFDVGFLDSESRFSVILNEVIYGPCAALRRFAQVLNAHLLLDTVDQVAELLATHARLADEGADVEDGEGMEGLAIYLR
jgi:hypothetical protein